MQGEGAAGKPAKKEYMFDNNKRSTGSKYEALAAAYLEGKGYRILARNFYTRGGEVDLIARDGRYLVFVEVKYRAGAACGDGMEAVNHRKQKRICRAASLYCSYYVGTVEAPCRFDVVAFDGEDGIRHLENAFEFCGSI